MEHHRIATNGIQLHVAQEGPKDGPLMILLHGFPECWHAWHAQIPYLADQGFRVWAPDQRGYNESDKPKDVSAYNIDILANDIIGLMDAAGREKVYLAGHDWGAAVAWWIGMKYPDRLHKLVTLNVPHPLVMQRFLRSNWKQIKQSWYIFFFQLPFLPEFGFSRDDGKQMANSLIRTAKPGSFSDDDIAILRKAWSMPGAVTGMLNWYRAFARTQPKLPPSPRISVPTLLIWGVHDIALRREMAKPSIDFCDDGRLVFFDEATHWVMRDEPERVNALIAEFCASK